MNIKSGFKKIITVFGNEVEEKDNLMVRLRPHLIKLFPEIEFQMADPTENLDPPGDPWIILDVGVGISDLVMIEDLKELDYVKGQSVHDYDVYMDLRLREKIGLLPRIKIILVPYDWGEEKALENVSTRLTSFFNSPLPLS
jgi:hypothetical protein